MNQNHEKAHASIRVTGQDLDPEQLTRLARVTPTVGHRTGERVTIVRADGTEKFRTQGTGIWSLRSKPSVSSPDLETHVAWLLERLKPFSNDLRTYLRQPGITAEMFCYRSSYRWPLVLAFGITVLEDMVTLGVSLVLDIYVQDEEEDSEEPG